ATSSFGANGANSFGLSSSGDQVYLFSGDGTDLTGYAHGFSFGAAAKDVSFGRYVTSTGNEDFVAQTSTTLGGPNTGPIVGPIVISEIMYHPVDIVVGNAAYDNIDDEFLELQNITAQPVALFDPNSPANMWSLRNAIAYAFPPNVTVPAGGSLMVVSFD